MTATGTTQAIAPEPGRVLGWLLRLAARIEPVGDPPEVIYGTLVAAGVIAAKARKGASAAGLVETTLAVLAMYWLAHVYSDILADRLRTRHGPGWRGVFVTALRDWSLLRGALLPVVVLGVGLLAGVEVNAASLIALWATVGLLGAWGLVAAARGGARGWELVFETIACALLGVVVAVLKIFVH